MNDRGCNQPSWELQRVDLRETTGIYVCDIQNFDKIWVFFSSIPWKIRVKSPKNGSYMLRHHHYLDIWFIMNLHANPSFCPHNFSGVLIQGILKDVSKEFTIWLYVYYLWCYVLILIHWLNIYSRVTGCSSGSGHVYRASKLYLCPRAPHLLGAFLGVSQ